MDRKQVDFTSVQLGKDGLPQYAVFLPALSTFYSAFVGKQRETGAYVDPARLPAGFDRGVEGINWLNPEDAYFYYKWALYSAGHAEIDINKQDWKDDMVRNRDRGASFVVGDSGGFQIGKGVWEGDWKDINCPKAALKRKQVLSWMDKYMDRGMILDIPAWTRNHPVGSKNAKIGKFEDAVTATTINNDYFMANRNGECKFLNVLQGEHETEADTWYDLMKHYCDPKKHDQPFDGWAMGGKHTKSLELSLRRLITLREEGLLEQGQHDWIHFLGTSKLEWAILLSDVQRAIRKYHNPNLTISFDCASPFLATANGQIYVANLLEDRKGWSYKMQPSVDNKKYATDTRKFSDAVLQDKIFKQFEESTISERCQIKDVCVYKPGDLNKLGKEGRTSWDAFSYAIQMSHNVHQHIKAVQDANALYYTKQSCPSKLVDERHDRMYLSDLIDEIFASDTGKALDLIEYHWKYLRSVSGLRGGIGAVTAHAMHDALFAYDDEVENQEHHIDDSGFDEANLDKLEGEV